VKFFFFFHVRTKIAKKKKKKMPSTEKTKFYFKSTEQVSDFESKTLVSSSEDQKFLYKSITCRKFKGINHSVGTL